MSIIIKESELLFGPYKETNVFHVEKSLIYKSLGENISSIEFFLLKNETEVLFIEAKSSSPKPGNKEDFDKYIEEIYSKFAHSIDLFFAILMRRLSDNKGEMPQNFKNLNYSSNEIKLILVINGHKVEWLEPITAALNRKLKRQIKTWRLKVTAMNDELAKEYGLILGS